MIKRCCMIFAVLLVLCMLATTVFANSPPPAPGEVAKALSPFEIGFIIFCVALFVAISITVTCFLEWLVSTFFDLDILYGKKIIWTNIISQIIMWAITYSWMFPEIRAFVNHHYVICIVILELTICICEFLVYMRIMKNTSWVKILFFTIAANMASMWLGILLQRVI